MKIFHLLFGLCFVVGCPDVQSGVFSCPDGRCPDGLMCHPDGLCRDTPIPDAGPIDAPTDDAPTDAPSVDAPTDVFVPDGGVEVPPIDMLFVVDNSNSMAVPQARLAEAFPDLMLSLATGRVTPESPMTFPPAEDIRVGVISTDMGIGPWTVPGGCDAMGDNAVLQQMTFASECGGEILPRWLDYQSSMLSQFRTDFGCKAQLGLMGCGFEQQLEGMLKAITPSTSPLQFHGPTLEMSTVGQADGPNAEFLRDGAVLVVVIVTDEEDCSTADLELFNPDTTEYPGDLNSRCITHSTALRPIGRYADALADLGRRVVFAPLIGMPADLDGDTPRDILDDDRMVAAFDERPVNVCTGMSVAAGAGPRYVEVAQELEAVSRGNARTAVGSICADDYGPFAERVLNAIVDVSSE